MAVKPGSYMWLNRLLFFHNKSLDRHLGKDLFLNEDSQFCVIRSATYGTSVKKPLPKKNKYSDTVILPNTTFPLRIPTAKRTEHELKIQKICKFAELYSWQREFVNNCEFILLDGPPYANGEPHIGHAVNKILKDITTRYKLLQGFKIHYKPGWDCHGLPIELKVLNLKENKTLTPEEIHNKAKSFAETAVTAQKKAFQRWGILGDWDNCYFTFSTDYITTQLQAFYKLFQKGLVYRDFKPVFWSPSTRTALAEAELEYNPEHKSTAVYCKFQLEKIPDFIKNIVGNNHAWALIWTTTPWTIPSNQGVCYSETLQYCLVKNTVSDDFFIIAAELKNSVESSISSQLEILTTFSGETLKDLSYIHPLYGSELPFLPGKHVTSSKGTGLVHMAPAHGLEDYIAAREFGIKTRNLVDEAGLYTDECDDSLIGKAVLREGNEAVLVMLKDNIVSRNEFIHSYPYDWRSKQPVILRASLQWFLDTEQIKDKAMSYLEQIPIFPESFRTGMMTQLRNRPHWCISRQRVWGVPIPVLFEKISDKPVINQELINYVCQVIKSKGTSEWWNIPAEELAKQAKLNPEEKYKRGNDILDIWFDSGIAWASVLSDTNSVSDVCIEGLDQSRGWFQTLLLTSVALQEKAPYRRLFFHGFTVDREGQKMSKSLGNVIDPQNIVNGGKDLQKEPSLGADVLRWWVASHVIGDNNIQVKTETITMCMNDIQKIRSVLRFILGTLNNFSFQESHVALEEMEPLDQYMMHLLYKFGRKVTEDFDQYAYDRAASRILNFVTNDVSGLYCQSIKNRLYCEEELGHRRRSCVTCLYHVLDFITRSIAPIIPHLSEEVFLHHKTKLEGDKTVFQSGWLKYDESWVTRKSLLQSMTLAMQIRDLLNKEITTKSMNAREIDVVIVVSKQIEELLKPVQTTSYSSQSALCELLQVASVNISNDVSKEDPERFLSQISFHPENQEGKPFNLILMQAKKKLCPRCRRYTSDSSVEPCSVCIEAMGEQWA